jgi:ElaB/YqjD/DUF883 family membrane-anchored ribosome-binding protein
MATTVMTEPERADARGRNLDSVRRLAHGAHEVRLVKSLAADALDDAVHASKRTIKIVKRRVHDLADRRYELAHTVRREPFKAVGLAFGAGILLGAVTAAVCATACRAPKEKLRL